MTNEEAIKISRAIRERVITLDALAEVAPTSAEHARAVLRDVAGTVADLYAATQRVPAAARESFMIACGL